MKPVALITGASGGIGRALSARFSAEGYSVVRTDKSLSPGPGTFVDLDLEALCRDPAARTDGISRLRQAIGGSELAVLVNNAAVQILGETSDLDASAWHHTLDVNVVAPALLVSELVDLLESGAGSVINIGSIHGRLTKPQFVAYATSKAALSGLTRAMAVDLGGRVRVNEIQPAATRTPMLEAGFVGKPDQRAALDAMHPIGRIAEPDEIARAAVWLASEQASFVTGALLGVDGGIAGRLHDPD